MDTPVDDVLERKRNRRILTIEPYAPVFEAVRKIADESLGALLVVAEGALVGILSERDYARKVVLRGRSSKDTRVDEIMTSPVIFVRPTNSVGECLALMNEKRIRHLPVLRGEQIYGVLSIGDLVSWIMADQTFRIDVLEGYITGRYPG